MTKLGPESGADGGDPNETRVSPPSAARISDTSPEAAAIQDEIVRRMSGEERLLLAMEMSEFARELTRARLRAEHPEWTEWEVTREILRYAFGSEPWPPPLR